ncbi:MAG: AAA family ATPase [Erysipelotrichaceae bacterium]|nr:AAA family ATPase [Erysipelotrichaceae bacterium]
MKIEISGYKNIENLEMYIDDYKINMLFGMSGSGKSSIAEALQKKDLEENCTLGKNIKQEILINGEENSSNVLIYNNEIVNSFISSKDTDGMYKVLIDNQKEIKDAEDKLRVQIKELSNSLSVNRSIYDSYMNIKGDLGSPLTNAGKLKSNAKINDLKKSLKSVSHSKSLKVIEKMSIPKINWLKEGLEIKGDNDNCPFCEKIISRRRIRKIQMVASFQSKSLQNLHNVNNTHAASGFINNIDLTLKSIEKFEKELIKMIKATNDYSRTEEFVNNVLNLEITNIKPIELSKEFKELFGDVYNKAQKVFKNINRIKGLTIASDNKAKKVLSRRLSPLNNYLDKMSIPYKVEAQYARGTIKDYKIIHISDPEGIDRPRSLSYGEKNMISLLLFIYQCKAEMTDLVIIDDPASSYDDFRRNQLLKIIKNELKNKTVLILSHDGIFAKYALADTSLNRGRIYFYENYGGNTKFSEIGKDDFGDFYDFVIDRIKNTDDYYQKIVNLRLLYEGSHSIVYGYLSAIVHNESKDLVDKLLVQKGQTEKAIIEKIKNNNSELKNITIPYYTYPIHRDISNYSLIEKAFLLRENYEDELKDEGLLDEINDYVHINRKLKVCLNPYKYGFITKKLHSYIENKKW